MGKNLSYKSNALKELLNKFNLKKTNIAKKTFGHTNNETVNRWLEGEDIYFTKLVEICNDKKIDILSFIELDGKGLRSTLMDVIALEEQGLSVRDLMQKNNLRVASDGTFVTLSPDFHQLGNPIVEKKVEQTKEIVQSSEWFVNKTISIYTEAEEKKRIALEQQKNSMQQIIDYQEAIIKELRKENKKLKLEIDSILKKTLMNEE